MLYGSNGRNGKSKLLNILKIFIGDSNTSGLNLQDIEIDQK
jgi:phage/plasmid-associated DNA primase